MESNKRLGGKMDVSLTLVFESIRNVITVYVYNTMLLVLSIYCNPFALQKMKDPLF